MPPLDRYDGLFPFIDSWEKEQAEFLGELLYETLKPKTVIDWGCASGLYLIPFRERGCKIFGLDGDELAGSLLRDEFSVREFVQADIRKDLQTKEHFDLALCIETAEHIQPEYADQLVENVAHSADTVFWSAAHKGQGGQNHYNEQSPGYWFDKFMARGFRPHAKHTEVVEAIQKNPACLKVQWLLLNAMLLTRTK